MTQSKRTRPPAEPKSTPAVPPITPSAPQIFLTAAQLASLGLDGGTAAAQLADANQVYAYIGSVGTQSSFCTRDMLVQWAATTWRPASPGSPLAVDRLNAALALLARMGLVTQVG